jgi:hypothetical protein
MPSGNPKDNFYGQLWARDFAHAASNYFAEHNPQAVIDSLETLLRHQRPDGALPYRVEREYAALRVVLPFPGVWRVTRFLFDVFEKSMRGRVEIPAYEGEFNGAEDTVPAVLLAVGALCMKSDRGREFVAKHFSSLEQALVYFKKKTDPSDGLAVVTHSNPDWAETIQRKGKLGFVNILYTESIKRMADITDAVGRDSRSYRSEYELLKKNVLSTLYDASGAYFRTQAGDTRLDTVASVLGARFLLEAEEALRVIHTLDARCMRSSGLVNFDPPYPLAQVLWIPRLFGNAGYHNAFVWPWVTCEYVRTLANIAKGTSNTEEREVLIQKAEGVLNGLAELFRENCAAEVFIADKRIPARSFFYNPPKNFLGSGTR